MHVRWQGGQGSNGKPQSFAFPTCAHKQQDDPITRRSFLVRGESSRIEPVVDHVNAFGWIAVKVHDLSLAAMRIGDDAARALRRERLTFDSQLRLVQRVEEDVQVLEPGNEPRALAQPFAVATIAGAIYV